MIVPPLIDNSTDVDWIRVYHCIHGAHKFSCVLRLQQMDTTLQCVTMLKHALSDLTRQAYIAQIPTSVSILRA